MSTLVWRAEELEEERQEQEARPSRYNLRRNGGSTHDVGGPQKAAPSCIPLQFIDDCNPVVRGSPKHMDAVLERAARELGVVWDHAKDAVHLGVNINENKYSKFREAKANAAFQLVRRLSRLPPREKKKTVLSHLLPTLTHGAGLHNTPSTKRRPTQLNGAGLLWEPGEGAAANGLQV